MVLFGDVSPATGDVLKVEYAEGDGVEAIIYVGRLLSNGHVECWEILPESQVKELAAKDVRCAKLVGRISLYELEEFQKFLKFYNWMQNWTQQLR